MVSFLLLLLLLLLGLCLLSVSQTAAGRHSFADDLVMFATLGDDIILPCGVASITSCSSVNWNMAGEFGSVSEVVKAGRVKAPRLRLLDDCSLQINHLMLDDARRYSCDSGALNSSVSLQILDVIERSAPADGTIELHCFLNIYKGLAICSNRGIHIRWSTEDNTPLTGTRFSIENPSDCFSKLIITKKLTDHRRKWRCQLTQNDTVKAAISYRTSVKDGIEEVFAAVGESASLSCGNTSSLDGSVQWTVGERTLTEDMSTETFSVHKDSSLVVSKVSSLHAGEYRCSESTDRRKVFNRIRLFTLDVIREQPGGDNLTLTCVLTCTKECETDLSLSWSGGGATRWQNALMGHNNTLRNTLVLSVLSSDERTCSVHRDGGVMSSKTWRAVNPLQTPAWAALPLALLVCSIAAGGIYVFMKRKRKDPGNEQPSIGMTHVYEIIQDADYEELQQQRQTKTGAVSTTDSFYDLLQAVN